MSDLNSEARRVFYESLDYADAEREVFLDRACEDNGELRRLTQALLDAHESPATFLDRPVVERTPQSTGRDVTDGTTREQVSRTSERAAFSGDDRYRVLRLHATGGLGEVFVAEDRELHREVALKEVRAEHAGDKDLTDRFLLEAEVTGHLEHPGIVPIYGAGHRDDGRPYYAMRFVRGGTLEDAIARYHGDGEGSASASERTHVFRQLLGRLVAVCQAAGYAHSKGVIHRDLKPSNVMLGQYGETLIVDWGLARVLDHGEDDDARESYFRPSGVSSTATHPGSAMGTPAYMSPEQASGNQERLGSASDVYSLGAMLYALLTGKAPFHGTLHDVIQAVQRGRFPRPRDVDTDVPRALEAVCLKAMALDPDIRYSSALELSRDIENWLADQPVSALREPLKTRAARWIRKHQRLTAATLTLAFVAVLAASAGGVWYQNFQSKRQAKRQRVARETTAALDRVEEAVDDLARALADTAAARTLNNDLVGWERQVASARSGWERAKLIADSDEQPIDAKLLERSRELNRWLQQHERHLQLAKRFDQIRLNAALVSSAGSISIDQAGIEYERLFRDALDVDIGRDNSERVAGKIRESRYRDLFMAALDHWSVSTQMAQSRQRTLLPRLLEIARKADSDPWRDRFHQMSAWTKRDERVTLAKEIDVAANPPHTIAALAFSLPAPVRRSLLKRSLLTYPSDFWLNFDLAHVCEDPRERAAYLRTAIALRPKSVGAYNNLGLALAAEGDVAGAIATFRKAMAIDAEGSTIAFVNLGVVYVRQNRYLEAVATLRKGLERYPNHVAGRTALATALTQLGRHDEGIQEYRAVLTIDPRYGTALGGLGLALLRECRYEEAVQAFEKALRLMPSGHAASRRLGEESAEARAHLALEKEKATHIALREGRVTVSGELKAGAMTEASPPNRGSPRAAYIIHLEAAKYYRIDAAARFQQCLRLEDARQRCLRFSEYISPMDRRRTRIVFTPRETGDYKIVVASRLPKQSGPFTLAVAEVQEFGKPKVQEIVAPEQLVIDGTQLGIAAGARLEAGWTYSFEVSGPSRPRFISIVTPDGKATPQARYVGPRQLGPTHIDLTPTVSGTHVVHIGSHTDVSEPRYTLRIRRFGPPPVTPNR